ncbi:MAG: CcmD family protein [Deltaproteobacteria bacterium]|jgi:CcmD family protein|nr:CcmD family protein [Deltaproteobacteria bacterium]
MDKASWLTCAFALVWVGLGAYLTALLLRLSRLEKRFRLLEALRRKEEPDNSCCAPQRKI